MGSLLDFMGFPQGLRAPKLFSSPAVCVALVGAAGGAVTRFQGPLSSFPFNILTCQLCGPEMLLDLCSTNIHRHARVYECRSGCRARQREGGGWKGAGWKGADASVARSVRIRRGAELAYGLLHTSVLRVE